MPSAACGVKRPQRKLEAIDRVLLIGEVPASAHGTPEPGVEGLDRVRGEDDSADLELEAKNGTNSARVQSVRSRSGLVVEGVEASMTVQISAVFVSMV